MATDGQPVKTTPTIIASGPAERHDSRRRMTLAKPSSRPVTHRLIGREPVSARAGPSPSTTSRQSKNVEGQMNACVVGARQTIGRACRRGHDL